MSYAASKAIFVAQQPEDADFARRVLQESGAQVSEFSSLEDFQRAAKDQPSVIGSIAVIAGTNGEASDSSRLANFRAKFPRLPVMVASQSVSVPLAVSLMRQGASDVVTLPCPSDQFRVQLGRLFDEAKQQQESGAEKLEIQARMAELTAAENGVLDLLLEGHANKQISQMLGIGLRTVELRRSKIMKKMKANSIAELIKMICIGKGMASLSNGSASDDSASSGGEIS